MRDFMLCLVEDNQHCSISTISFPEFQVRWSSRLPGVLPTVHLHFFASFSLTRGPSSLKRSVPRLRYRDRECHVMFGSTFWVSFVDTYRLDVSEPCFQSVVLIQRKIFTNKHHTTSKRPVAGGNYTFKQNLKIRSLEMTDF